MKYIDPHIHCFSRTVDDYQNMARHGCLAVIEPAFWLGHDRKYAESFFDYFDHLIEFERARALKYGIAHFSMIAINPKEANDRPMATKVIDRIGAFLDRPSVVGVGEIGYDKITDAEEEMMKRQIEVAMKHDAPILIHTPHVNKAEGTRRTIKVLQDMKIPPHKVLMDHNTEETVEISRDSGCWVGFSLYPITKMSPTRMVAVLKKHGCERMIMNSAADWSQSDPLAIPKTVELLWGDGFNEAQVRKVVWENPFDFFKQSPQFKIPGVNA